VNRARQLFLDALTLTPEARRALLNRECAENEALRGEVERLLELDGVEGSFLDRPPPPAAVAALLEAATVRPKGQAGPYRLVEEVGRGGMGVVYRAVRNDGQFEHEVAVKVLSTLVMDSEARARFERERQILARLDHPYIATLFDGGLIEERVPFYVMRLVRGEPIDTYCDHHRLSVEERLELFLKVCEAVQFAHDRLIVHRDLKPDNVLVSEDGSPRLLDFGIATLSSGDGARDTGGAESERAMTPGYASPEQARGEAVTTSSDVYSLGVVLYQLLVGCLPPVTSEGSTVPPSKAVPAADLSEVARDRASRPVSLRRRLAGDLDRVVCKALSVDTGDRYPSVRELAAELRRFLGGFPVEVSSASWARRAVLWSRRNRAVSALAATLVAVLVGGSALLGVQNLEIRRERDVAQAVTGFLVDLFQVSDPSRSQGRELSAKDILDRGAERLDSELVENPELRAHLASTMGIVYQSLGLLDEAGAQLELALDLRRALPGGEPGLIASCASDLAGLLLLTGKLERAEELNREALEIRLRLNGPRSLEVAVNRNNLALVLIDQDRLDEAEALASSAMELLRKHHPEARTELADASVTLGTLFLERGELEEAEQHLRFGREVRQELGEDLPRLAAAENNLGDAMRRSGRYDEAEALLTRAVASRRELLGDHHPGLAISLSNLAVVYYERGDFETMGELLAEACAIFRSGEGPEHRGYLTCLNNLAALRFKTGDHEGSVELFREVLALRRETVGEEHSDTAQALQNLGSVLRAHGKPEEAVGLLRRALEIRLRLFGAADARVATTQENLASTLVDLGIEEPAETLFRQAISALETALPEIHPQQARVRLRLAKLLAGQRRFEEARGLLEAAMAIWAASSAGDPSLIIEARSLLVTSLSGLGAITEAEGEAGDLAESLRGFSFTDSRTETEVLTRLIDFFTERGGDTRLDPLLSRRAALAPS
jgi:eukaryotic-like serine/threonine-protein kinase